MILKSNERKNKKGPSHFIMRRLYLFKCVRILRHNLYGSTLDWSVIYVMDEIE